MDQPGLLDQKPRQIADTSREAFDQIRPDLRQHELDVFALVWAYLEATGYPDVTGGELAAWSGRLITSLRPRLTGLTQKSWLYAHAKRASRAKHEGVCHPYSPAVSLAAVTRPAP